MSIVEELHAAHKERQLRLRAIPAKVTSVLELDLQRELRELQLSFHRQQATIAELNSTITKQRKLIRQFADEGDSPSPRVADVVAVIAQHFGFTKMVIIGAQRTGPIAHARQVGYYICRELGFPWHAIGRGFQKDHTSALHGSRQIAERLLIDKDEKLALEIEEIQTAIDKYAQRRVATASVAL